MRLVVFASWFRVMPYFISLYRLLIEVCCRTRQKGENVCGMMVSRGGFRCLHNET
jgi:hypothetical protein